MGSPLVSVLLPAYNRADYVGEALQSAIDQTFRDLEIVVVDDGSTDNTAQVIGQFTDPRVRLIQREHKGVTGALNTAFRASRGAYIAFLGSDDLWLPNLLAELVPVLNAHPEIGLVNARAQAMDAEGRVLPRIIGAPEKYPGQMFKSLLYGDHICGQTVLCRREHIERVGLWDESLRVFEDWDIWLRLAQVCRFYFIDKILARVRMHRGRMTGKASSLFERGLADRVRVLGKVYASPNLPRDILEFKPLAYTNLYVDIGLRWRQVDWRPALGYFICAVKTSPQPFITLTRIVYLILFHNVLSKHAWGTRLVNAWLARRRQGAIARTISQAGELGD